MSLSNSPRALAIGAHPDDVEIYCPGLLLRLRARGWRIGWVVATDGGRGGDPAVRRGEAVRAAALFGVTPEVLSLPDGALAGDPRAAGLIGACLDRARPDLVITHAAFDYHPDHRALGRLVPDACGYGVAHVAADALFGAGPQPDLLIDISAHAGDKRAALAVHVSQADCLSPDDLAAWARLRALQTFHPAIRAAEGYFLPSGPGRSLALRALAPLIAVNPKWAAGPN